MVPVFHQFWDLLRFWPAWPSRHATVRRAGRSFGVSYQSGNVPLGESCNAQSGCPRPPCRSLYRASSPVHLLRNDYCWLRRYVGYSGQSIETVVQKMNGKGTLLLELLELRDCVIEISDECIILVIRNFRKNRYRAFEVLGLKWWRNSKGLAIYAKDDLTPNAFLCELAELDLTQAWTEIGLRATDMCAQACIWMLLIGSCMRCDQIRPPARGDGSIKNWKPRAVRQPAQMMIVPKITFPQPILKAF